MKPRSKKTTHSTQQLNDQICQLLQNTPYAVKYLSIDDKHFGNVYLELSDSIRDFRFIQDRGDVYVEKKIAGVTQWSDHLFFSHNASDESYYGLLLKAVTQIAKNGQ